jgi:hypothetical protein
MLSKMASRMLCACDLQTQVFYSNSLAGCNFGSVDLRFEKHMLAGSSKQGPTLILHVPHVNVERFQICGKIKPTQWKRCASSATLGADWGWGSAMRECEALRCL